jgi:hypothetical protein
MNDRQANDASRERNPRDQREQAAQASERTISEFAEGASRVKDATAKATDQAVRAGLEMFQRNAETVQHTLECGAKLASRMTERSANQFGRAFGLSGEGGEEAAKRSSRNIEAVVQSGTTLTDMTQRFFDEWADISRARIDRAFDRMSVLSQRGTPCASGPHASPQFSAPRWPFAPLLPDPPSPPYLPKGAKGGGAMVVNWRPPPKTAQ